MRKVVNDGAESRPLGRIFYSPSVPEIPVITVVTVVVVGFGDSAVLDAIQYAPDDRVRTQFGNRTFDRRPRSAAGGDHEHNGSGKSCEDLRVWQEADRGRVDQDPIEGRCCLADDVSHAVGDEVRERSRTGASGGQ